MAELRVLAALRVEALAVGGAVQVIGDGARQRGAPATQLAASLDGPVAVAWSGGRRPFAGAGTRATSSSRAELRTLDGRRVAVPSRAASWRPSSRVPVSACRHGPIVSVPRFVRAGERSALARPGALSPPTWSRPGSPTVSRRHPARRRPDRRRLARSGGPFVGGLAGARAPAQGCGRPLEALGTCPWRRRSRAGRPPLVLRRGRAGHRDRRAGHSTASARRSTCAARSSTTRMWSPTSRHKGAVFVQELDEVPDGATVVLAAHGVSPEVRAAGRGPPRPRRSSTPPARSWPRCTTRPAASRPRAAASCSSATPTTRRSIGTLGEVPDAHRPGRERRRRRRPALRARRPRSPISPRRRWPSTRPPRSSRRSATASTRSCGPSANDICYASQNRQDAVRSLAGRCDLVLVVGSANSSNTARLVEVARREGCRAELVEDASRPRARLAGRRRGARRHRRRLRPRVPRRKSSSTRSAASGRSRSPNTEPSRNPSASPSPNRCADANSHATEPSNRSPPAPQQG